jgi:hypothetical protein
MTCLYNEYRFNPPPGELADEFIALVAGDVGWDDFRTWVLRFSDKR